MKFGRADTHDLKMASGGNGHGVHDHDVTMTDKHDLNGGPFFKAP